MFCSVFLCFLLFFSPVLARTFDSYFVSVKTKPISYSRFTFSPALLLFLRQLYPRFSMTDVQEMDAVVSSFNAFETKEAGPLILTWAVFLCLISSLPGKEENNAVLVIFFFP